MGNIALRFEVFKRRCDLIGKACIDNRIQRLDKILSAAIAYGNAGRGIQMSNFRKRTQRLSEICRRCGILGDHQQLEVAQIQPSRHGPIQSVQRIVYIVASRGIGEVRRAILSFFRIAVGLADLGHANGDFKCPVRFLINAADQHIGLPFNFIRIAATAEQQTERAEQHKHFYFAQPDRPPL